MEIESIVNMLNTNGVLKVNLRAGDFLITAYRVGNIIRIDIKGVDDYEG